MSRCHLHSSLPLPIPHTHCAFCGYSLTRLPSIGRCPECGATYDDRTLILFGWPPGRFGASPALTILYILGICGSINLWSCGGIDAIGALVLSFQRQWPAAGLALLFAAGYGVAGSVMFLLARRPRRRAERIKLNPNSLGKPTIQIRLNPEGYSARHGFGPPHDVLGWKCDFEIDLTHTDSVARLRIVRVSPVGSIDWSTIVDVAFTATYEQVSNLRAFIELLRVGSSIKPVD